MAVNTAGWGSKIGPRVAMLVSQAIIHTHTKLVAVKHKLAMAIFHAISDEISEEVDVTLGPIIARIHGAMDESHPSYPVINFLHTQKGQLKAIVGSGLQMTGILGSISTVLNNELSSIVYNIVKSNPGLLPDPSIVAASYAQGLVSENEAIGAIGAQGIQHGWAQNMLLQATTWPTVPDALEFLRRGYTDHANFVRYMRMNGIPADIANLYSNLWEVPVSVADAALAVLRGNITQDQGVEIARENGYSPESFGILVNNTGEPPGLEQLLEGYRRGFIDQGTLKRGILESRYRNEWIPLLEKLRYSPMTVSDAVNAVVQNHLDMHAGETIAEQNGLEPGAFATLYETAGEPLSRTEMQELYNRGLATEHDVLQASAESRLKNKYAKLAFELHRRLIPARELGTALRHGAVTTADAVKIAMEQGYSKDDATVIVNSGLSARLQMYKDRVVSSVQSLYEDNIVSAQYAQSVTEGMGYSKSEAAFIARASEFHRESRVLSQVVSSVRSKYVGRHITRNEAIGAIDATGIPAEQRDYLIRLWDIEHGANVRTLTEAQVIKAVKLQLISAADGQGRLEAMGYAASDAELLIGGA